MTKRYFKASDGVFTIFRASDSRVYASAWMTVDGFKTRPTNMGFSAKPVYRAAEGVSGLPSALSAVEIDKAEYNALVRAKKARTEDNAPSASWVRNADLPRTTT